MLIGLPKEKKEGESRVAMTPEGVRKLCKKGFRVIVERAAGYSAGFPDSQYQKEGAELGERKDALGADIIFKIHRPENEEIAGMKKGSLLLSLLEPYREDGLIEILAQSGIEACSMELIPRTSRAQTMDVLSSQANIAGYRAVIEAAARYGRFFPLMMTSAGSAKAAKVIVLGAGVAGLQAIATAKRLGAQVEAYDIRPEVKEQIQSLGAKFIELEVGETGIGQGGYAKELSEEGKKRQMALLSERLKKSDIIISTANIPGRKAPLLVSEEAVQGMRPGSVIVDMAAGSGGNCPLSEVDKVVVRHDVTIVGFTNYPSLVAADASNFYGNNLISFLDLMVEKTPEKLTLNFNLDDDIIAAALITYQGNIRLKRI